MEIAIAITGEGLTLGGGPPAGATGGRRCTELASGHTGTQGEIPCPPQVSQQWWRFFAPLSSLEALLMWYVQVVCVVVKCCGKPFEGILIQHYASVDIGNASWYHSLPGDDVDIPSHSYARRRFTWKDLASNRDGPSVKFLRRWEMWWIGATWRYCKVEAETKKKNET